MKPESWFGLVVATVMMAAVLGELVIRPAILDMNSEIKELAKK